MREERTIRERHADLADTVDQLARDDGGSAGAMLVQTQTVGTYPTTAGSYYAVKSVDPGGAETEGGSGTFTAGTDTFYALNSGSSVPPSGTKVIVQPIGGRWVFSYNG